MNPLFTTELRSTLIHFLCGIGCPAYDAEDIVHDVLLKCHTEMKTNKNKICEAYLKAMVKNKFIDLKRSTQKLLIDKQIPEKLKASVYILVIDTGDNTYRHKIIKE